MNFFFHNFFQNNFPKFAHKIEIETLFIYVTFFSLGIRFSIQCNFYLYTIVLGSLMILEQNNI